MTVPRPRVVGRGTGPDLDARPGMPPVPGPWAAADRAMTTAPGPRGAAGTGGEVRQGAAPPSGHVADGRRIRELRRARRLTQEQLAAQVGVIQPVISRLESGRTSRPE